MATETIYYQQPGALVTSSRFVAGATTYAVAALTSVRVVPDEAHARWMAGLGTVPGMLGGVALFALGAGAVPALLAFVAGCLAGAVARAASRRYEVRATTAAGEVVALRGLDALQGQQVAAALDQALASR